MKNRLVSKKNVVFNILQLSYVHRARFVYTHTVYLNQLNFEYIMYEVLSLADEYAISYRYISKIMLW